MTALSPVSKGDLAFLCLPAGLGAASAIVDASEQRTNLVNNTTYVSEAASVRTALGSPRTVVVVVDMTSGDTGRLLQHGSSDVAVSYAVHKTSTTVSCAENNIVRVSVTVPGLAAGSRKVLVHWAQRADGTQVRSELAVYNFVTGEWAFATAVHAAFAPTPTDKLTIGAGSLGNSAYSLGMAAFYAVAIGRRFHSTTETVIDFIAVPVPPAMPEQRRTPLRTWPSAEVGFAAEGHLAGPQYLHAVGATRDADSRLVTPLVNLIITHPHSEVQAPTARYNLAAPGAVAYRLSTRWLWHAWPSPMVNAARVRIHVAITGAGGVCPIYFRMFSIANLPMGQPNPPPLSYYATTEAVIASSTGTDGVWLDLGQVRLARDDGGMTALALALDFNHGVADAFGTSVKIRAVTVEPLFADFGSGGYGDVDEGKGI